MSLFPTKYRKQLMVQEKMRVYSEKQIWMRELWSTFQGMLIGAGLSAGVWVYLEVTRAFYCP